MNAADCNYELILTEAGACILMCGDEQMWTSDGDDDFIEEFGDEVIDESDLPEVQEFLVDEGYVPPGVDVEIVTDAAEESEWFGEGDSE